MYSRLSSLIKSRADRLASEYFFLQFSFANTYPESLAVGEEQQARAVAREATEIERMRNEESDEKVAKAKAEEERLRKLSEGL